MPVILHKEKGRIVAVGMGGFLNPPGHPTHNLSVETELNRRPENRGRMSLEAAAGCHWLDDATKAKAAKALAKWKRLPLYTPETRKWISQVLGYFAHCYNDQPENPEGWNAGQLTIDHKRSHLTTRSAMLGST